MLYERPADGAVAEFEFADPVPPGGVLRRVSRRVSRNRRVAAPFARRRSSRRARAQPLGGTFHRRLYLDHRGCRIAAAINAVKWSLADGTVDVALPDGALTVRDHGPGFVPGDPEHVFERFSRADLARGTPGSCLGLAIVGQAAEAHGGSVEPANAPGGGAQIRVRFAPPARPG